MTYVEVIPYICHFFYTDRIFENQILHPKKRLKSPKTLKMSLKKSYICIFFTHSGKIYTWQKIFTQTCLWCLWQIKGMIGSKVGWCVMVSRGISWNTGSCLLQTCPTCGVKICQHNNAMNLIITSFWIILLITIEFWLLGHEFKVVSRKKELNVCCRLQGEPRSY